MVSWSDGSDSSEHTLEYMSSASDDGTIKVPASIEDSDFEGPETELHVLCHGHGKASERRVAFEGIHTGRRKSKRDRTEDNLMNYFDVHNLTQEKKKLQASYEKLVEDVNGLLDAQERRAEVERKDLESSKIQEKYDMVKNLAAAQANVIRNMKLKLAEERKNLQIHIDELQKTVEESNVKLEGIKAIING
ncbi:uncharacterized protein [Aegilops tauschii subsp. strangulata]|uniref:uncharacterized protein n=1 Tax=Aegilops tauschii subsp. strangulata TaxID=200361 RepID=UPI00098B45C5